MKLQDNYIRRAKVIRVFSKKPPVYDADTITVVIDYGYYTYGEITIRMYGLDAPEVRTKNKIEKKKGLKARDWLRKKINGKVIIVKSIKQGKKGKFGRFLCQLYLNDKCLNDILLKKGMGVPYFGGKR